MIPVTYVSHGIGNNFGDSIELNEHLKEYPKLHDKVLKHERSHTNKFISKKDVALDLFSSDIDSISMLKFMLKYPKSFSQLLPFYWTRKHGFVYDVNLILMYSVVLIIILGGFFLVKLV